MLATTITSKWKFDSRCDQVHLLPTPRILTICMVCLLLVLKNMTVLLLIYDKYKITKSKSTDKDPFRYFYMQFNICIIINFYL